MTVLIMSVMKLTSPPTIMIYLLHIPKHNVLIIGEDMNALIGKYKNDKFYLHKSPNRIDEYLAKFSLKNRFVYLNTKFQQKIGKAWTYI